MQNPKTIKILYWTFTILYALFMLFSAFSEIMQTDSAKAALIALGYPIYLNFILGIAKIAGAVAMVQTKFKTIKEWAYAGFAIDLIGAGASYLLNGNGFIPLLFLIPFFAVLCASYFLWKKMENVRKK